MFASVMALTLQEYLPVSSSLPHPGAVNVALSNFQSILRTFFKCWNRSKKEPSLENTFAGLTFGTLGFGVLAVDGAAGAGEAYPLEGCGTGVPLADLLDISLFEPEL